ncbi:MAG: methylthioribulose 1-phosphate dehydratase [Planctomycetota bacterium]
MIDDPQVNRNLPQEHPLSGCEESIRELIECGQLFHSRGWSVGTSSNYSVVLNNDPVELIVTASGKDKGRLQLPDFVHVGSEGKPIEPDQPKSSAETMLHVVLAQQEEIGAILHTHSIWGTLLSDYFFKDGGFEIAGFEMLKGLEGIKTHDYSHWIPIFENTQDIPALAAEVSERLQDPMESMTHGFLIRKHGLYTWGKDLFSARRHIEIYEFLFECIARKINFAENN